MSDEIDEKDLIDVIESGDGGTAYDSCGYCGAAVDECDVLICDECGAEYCDSCSTETGCPSCDE